MSDIIDKYTNESYNRITELFKKINGIYGGITDSRTSMVSPTIVSGLKLSEFIGQEQTVDLVKMAVDSAKKQKLPLNHVLIYGGPGLGKSLLARTLACEMNAYYKEFLGSELREKTIIQDLFTFLKLPYDNKMIFIDEVHNISLKSAELLYEAVQDFSIKNEKIKRFTLISATTNSGKIFKPLRERFSYALKLTPYSVKEICKILKLKYPSFGDNVISFIAERSKATPRIGKHYADMIINAAMHDSKNPEMKHATFVMNVLNVGADGLTADDIAVLKLLSDNKIPMSKNTICSVLSLDLSDYEWLIEPILLNLGYMRILPKGRDLTDKGRMYMISLSQKEIKE